MAVNREVGVHDDVEEQHRMNKLDALSQEWTHKTRTRFRQNRHCSTHSNLNTHLGELVGEAHLGDDARVDGAGQPEHEEETDHQQAQLARAWTRV